MEESSEIELTYQEKDQLNCSIDKPKEAIDKGKETNTQPFNPPTSKVSFRDTLCPSPPPPINPNLEIEFLKKITLD